MLLCTLSIPDPPHILQCLHHCCWQSRVNMDILSWLCYLDTIYKISLEAYFIELPNNRRNTSMEKHFLLTYPRQLSRNLLLKMLVGIIKVIMSKLVFSLSYSFAIFNFYMFSLKIYFIIRNLEKADNQNGEIKKLIKHHPERTLFILSQFI